MRPSRFCERPVLGAVLLTLALMRPASGQG
jgi:hypothetical protein